jgi:acetylornithine/N-succinyldiaminopimelate aminotransferase
VRGAGLLLALVMPDGNAETVAATARDNGLIVNAARPDTLRFMPALNVTAEEIGICLEILDRVFTRQAPERKV